MKQKLANPTTAACSAAAATAAATATATARHAKEKVFRLFTPVVLLRDVSWKKLIGSG